VADYGITAVKVHDARLIASMLAHRISHLLTLNGADSVLFEDLITVVHPQDPRATAGG